MKKIVLQISFILIYFGINAQIPPPCSNGTQAVCKCSTAPLLCTIDQLDGYVFTMTNYQHPGDGPNPLCAGQGGVPNNPSWFAFKAWCTDLSLDCSVSSCTGQGGSNGIQIAIYSGCNPYVPIACNVAPGNCNLNTKTLNLTGLTIGATYYFMVDGCAGSYCTVTIDINGVCGEEKIEDWKGPIAGETEICASKTETYTIEKVDGATSYIWYLDGVIVKDGVSNTFTKNWTTPGTYTLCVDAYNDPCIPVTNDPLQTCITIVVNKADAGTITANPTPACPDAPVTYGVTGFLAGPNNTEMVFVTNSAGVIQEIFPTTNGTWTSSVCGTFTFYSYNYVNTGGSFVPSVGDNVSSIDCNANCCDLKSKQVVFQDSQKPVLQNKPANQTLACYDLLTPMLDLSYTDNCIPSGTVMGVETGTADLCMGGTITRTWTIEDKCGNVDTHTQTITITATPAPTWTSTLANQTISCDQIPTTHPDLNYSNTGVGACKIMGAVSPTVTGSADLCGGAITRNWTFTDACGHNITSQQVLTVTPVPVAAFVTPPASQTITCANIPTTHPDLSYTNGITGACGINGTVSPVVTGSADLCGGAITRTWTFTDVCNRVITYAQVLTVTPVPIAAFVMPPASLTVACDQIPTTNPDLTYTNGLTGACGINGTVSPVVTGTANLCGGTITRVWTYTDACNRTITHTQVITATPVPIAAFVMPPASLTVACDQIPTTNPDLTYTNGLTGACGINGTVSPVVTGSANLCGGTITRVWTYTDACARTITHTQTITATPVPIATFQNLPPASITVACDQIPTSAPNLTYTNGLTGACGINGSITPVQAGSANLCGGVITYTWSFTDVCNRTINHVQTVTATPVPVAYFVSPPASQTVSCAQIPTSAPNLTYTNNLTGACGINGSITPVQSGLANLCGGVLTYTWNYTDACNRTINHVQTFTATPVPVAAFQNPPGDQTVQCANIPVTAPDLNYTNGLTGNCGIVGSVAAVKTGNSDLCGGVTTFTWTYIDVCNRVITHVQNYNATPVPVAAFQNPPASQTVTCENIPTGAQNLSYTNGLIGNCGIFGSVPATLIGVPSVCGGTFQYQWQFTDVCNRIISYSQDISVIPTPPAAFVNPPKDLAANCKDVMINPPTLNYTNGKSGNCGISGTANATVISNYNECGGEVQYLWDYIDVCNRVIEYTQTLTVNPASIAVFTAAPPDITVQCDAVPMLDQALGYNNNETGVCKISGSEQPDITGSHDFCGGDYLQTWNFTDNCNRTITKKRKITVLPAPLPVFSNMPPNVTVDCAAASLIDQTQLLSYTNNKSGDCGNQGDVEAVTTGSYDPCGGALKRTWTLNTCGSLVKYVQDIKVLPAPEPTFFAPPADITLACGDPYPAATELYYTNNGLDECDISGFVTPDQFLDKNVMTFTWEFTNPCSNKKITKIQKIYGKPIPDIVLAPTTTTICLGSSYDLTKIVVTDKNNSNPSITFHSGTPANGGNKLNSTIVSPTVTTTYYVLATNTVCTDEAPFVVKVDTALVAGGDGAGIVCFGAVDVDLFSYLTGKYSKVGVWKNKGTGTINLFDPSKVSFNNSPAAVYGFYYIVPSVGPCPPDTATVNITVKPEIVISIDSFYCTSDLNFYNVIVTSSGYTLTATAGTVTSLGNNTYNIGPIPVASAVTITATETSTGCKKDFSVNPPNCNCPQVPAPISGGNKILCVGDPIPFLTVTVGVDEEADWYDSPSGGALLQAASLQYKPIISLPGVYKFYVEAKSTLFPDCKSNIRTEIQIEIIDKPAGNNASLFKCNEDGNGHAVFDLTLANPQMNPNASLTFAYYISAADATTEKNALPSSYTNTSSPQTIYVVIKNQTGCKKQVTLTLNIFPKIVLTLTPKAETCAGTKDATVTVSNTGGTGQVEFSIDNTNWVTTKTFTGLSAGNYTIYARDTANCLSSATVIVPPGLILNAAMFDILCNNNGTDTDPKDDYYVVSFNIGNNKANAGTFTLSDGTTNLGTFSYGVLKTVNIPANGQSLVLTFQDVVNGCKITQNIGPLTPCSTNCKITITTYTKTCKDNGTNTDPLDDYYVITINATAANGSASNTFNVVIGGNVVATFTYGVGGTFNLPADGSNPTITLVDTDDNQCTKPKAQEV